MSSSISSFSWRNKPKYLNFSILHIVIISMVTSPLPFSPPLKPHLKYSIFDLFNLKPLDSMICLHNSYLLLTAFLISLIRTISSVNIIHYGTSSWISLVSSSIMIVKRNGLKANPWWSPISTGNLLVLAPNIWTLVFTSSYIRIITRIYAVGTPFLSKHLH